MFFFFESFLESVVSVCYGKFMSLIFIFMCHVWIWVGVVVNHYVILWVFQCLLWVLDSSKLFCIEKWEFCNTIRGGFLCIRLKVLACGLVLLLSFLFASFETLISFLDENHRTSLITFLETILKKQFLRIVMETFFIVFKNKILFRNFRMKNSFLNLLFVKTLCIYVKSKNFQSIFHCFNYCS